MFILNKQPPSCAFTQATDTSRCAEHHTHQMGYAEDSVKKRLTVRQAGRHTHTHTGRQTHTHTGRQTHTHTGRQTDRQTEESKEGCIKKGRQ